VLTFTLISPIGKEWSDNLPTDAEILMNAFCCMMDNTLPADNERDRPFWKSYYFSKGPNRPFTPRVRSRLFLVQTVSRAPHFKVLTKGAVREIVPVRSLATHSAVSIVSRLTSCATHRVQPPGRGQHFPRHCGLHERHQEEESGAFCVHLHLQTAGI
jgi:hypothetical protein